jgi:hypothetical protein
MPGKKTKTKPMPKLKQPAIQDAIEVAMEGTTDIVPVPETACVNQEFTVVDNISSALEDVPSWVSHLDSVPIGLGLPSTNDYLTNTAKHFPSHRKSKNGQPESWTNAHMIRYLASDAATNKKERGSLRVFCLLCYNHAIETDGESIAT